MKNIYKIGFLYTLISLLLTYTILGSNNILPNSDDWMLHGDAAQDLVIWKYFFNDVLDCDQDQQHPRKKYRPIASGKISKSFALL